MVGNSPICKWDNLGLISLGAKITAIFAAKTAMSGGILMATNWIFAYTKINLSDDENEIAPNFESNIKFVIIAFLKANKDSLTGSYRKFKLPQTNLAGGKGKELNIVQKKRFDTGFWLGSTARLFLKGSLLARICGKYIEFKNQNLTLNWIDHIDAKSFWEDDAKLAENLWDIREKMAATDFLLSITSIFNKKNKDKFKIK
jgi:hypothetical protein